MTYKGKQVWRWLCFVTLWLTVSCTATEKQLESIYGIVLSKGNVRVQVNSNGCTSSDSFSLDIKDGSLAIYRVKPDRCRRRSFRVWIDFPEHRRLSGLKLINPIKFFDKPYK
jgi:hypothetical protein